MGYAVVEGYIRRLEKQQAKRAGSVQDADAYSFALSPTCPPSTSIVFRGGLTWWPAYSLYPAGFHIPTYEVNLADAAKTSVRINYSDYTYTFTNAYWYAPALVIISQMLWPPPDPWPDTVPDDAIYLYGGTGSPYLQEFETAAGAETELRTINRDTASDYGIVAGGVILRNNGNTLIQNQYQSIDAANRGRSYLFGNMRTGWQMG